MASSDIEKRVRSYLLMLSDEELDSSELISNIIEAIEDWWETGDGNLSDIASRRRKIETITNIVTSILFTYWKNADDSIYDAVQRAIEANLYNAIAQRQKKRKSVSAKHNAYFAEVVKKKLVTELPRPSSVSPGRTRPDDQRRDRSDHMARDEQESVLRANLGRPSVNPVNFEDPATLHNASLLLQPDVLPNSTVNLPSLNITAIGAAQVNAPDLSIEEQMLNIPMPEIVPVNGHPQGFDTVAPRLMQDAGVVRDFFTVPNRTGPDDAAIEALMATIADLIQPDTVPALVRPDPVADLVQPDPVPDIVNEPAVVPRNIPPPEVVAAPLPTDESNATLPDSNTLGDNLPPVRLSQILPTRRPKPNKNLIIDRVTVIKNYARRSIQLNKSLQVKQTDPHRCELQKVKHAMSVTRLFSSPACTPMYSPVRCNKLENLYTRHLILNRRGIRDIIPVTTPPTGNVVPSGPVHRQTVLDVPLAPEQQSPPHEHPPIRLAQTMRRQTDQIVDSPVQNLRTDTSHPVTVIPPTPETTSPDELLDETIANTVHIFPHVETRRNSSDIFSVAAVETHHEISAASEGTVPVHEIQTAARFPDETRAVISVASEPSIPPAQTVHTEIPAASEVQISNESRFDITAATEISIPAPQLPTEIPAVNDIQPVEIVDEIPTAGDMAKQCSIRLPHNGPDQIVTVGERDLPQDPSKEFQNIEITRLLQEHTLTPIENLIGGVCTKRSKIALVRKLLKLNRLWLVRVVAINRKVFVTKFPEGMAAANTSNECA